MDVFNAAGNIAPFDATTDWPEPDMHISQPARPPAPVMTPDEFDAVFGPWAGWLREAAEVKGAPVDYVVLSLLTTASVCLGNARWACPWQGWQEPPVLWGMCVGDPSAGKSPALDAVMDAVREIERELSEEYTAARKDWEAENEIASLKMDQWRKEAKAALGEGLEAPAKPDDAGSPPLRQRISVADATVEKVAELLAAGWRGLLLSRDELSGWMGSMDRYSGGGDRPFWLEAYGGRPYSVDRKAKPEPILIDHLSVSVIGGTQPDKLQSLLVNSDDDGLLARFMTVYPEPAPLSRPNAQLDIERLRVALERLRGLKPYQDETHTQRPLYLYFSEAAASVLQEFRGECRNWEADANTLMKGHIGKMPGLAVRIANVLAHLDWAATGDPHYPTEIHETHVGRACHFVGEYLRSHAYRAYGTAKLPKEVIAAKSVIEVIRAERPRAFKVRDIQQRKRTGLLKSDDVKAALNVLVDADWLREIKQPTGGKPRITYAVNPKLWGQL